jgi:hypothetical protein
LGFNWVAYWASIKGPNQKKKKAQTTKINKQKKKARKNK